VDFFGELSDKALHFIAYFDRAVMAAAGFKNRRVGVSLKPRRNRLGGTLKIVQGLTGREMSIYDELANAAGIIARIVFGKGDQSGRCGAGWNIGELGDSRP
jgi:hypothetical protein